MAAGDRVIRDPIYGYIEVPHELIGIVDHPLFQRLRRVSQTSLTGYVYPSATGTRFEHALGVMYLADRAWAAVWAHMGQEKNHPVRRAFIKAAHDEVEKLPTDPERFGGCMRLAFCAAALLHDVGHPPFSHALEAVFKSHVWPQADDQPSGALAIELEEGIVTFHEFCGRQIARRICEEVFLDPDDDASAGKREAVLRILEAKTTSRTWAGELHGLIAGEVDIDRIDYLIRDSHKAAGSEFGSIDYIRLLDALEMNFDPDDEEQRLLRIAPGVRARSAVETLLIQRLQAYEYIHFHPRVVGFNVALRRAVETFLELSKADPGEAWTSISVKTLFRRVLPNLVYWDTTRVDAVGALGMWQPPSAKSKDDQASMFDPVVDAEQFVVGLETQDRYLKAAAACVDDGTIIETLKRAYLLAGIAPPRYADDVAIGDRLEKFRIYAQVALFRRKKFVPAWKSVDEYVDAAAEMRESLLEAAPDRLRARAAESQGEAAGMLDAIAQRIDAALSVKPQRRSAVISLNTLMDLVLFRPALLKKLREGLNVSPTVGEKDGIWEVSYSGAGPVRPLKVELYAKKRLVSLADRSPLTEAVWLAEERRMKLAVFFFFAELDFSDPAAGAAGRYREQIRTEVVERLPKLVLEVVDEYV